MIITSQKNIIIITSNHADFDTFFSDFINKTDTFLDKNVILDLSFLDDVTLKNIASFAQVAKVFKQQKKSFVVVAINIDFNKISTKINVVPTLQEAFDVIEMEEIERDLGF